MQQQEVTYIFKDLKLFPSANIMLKQHFSAVTKRRDQLQWLIREQGTQIKFVGPVKIRYIRHAVKLQDWDNHCISFKQAGDALIRCGVIEDDNPKIVREFQPEQYRVKHFEEQKIIIKIYSLTI